MNFDFSDEQKSLQHDVQRVLRDQSPLDVCRGVLEGGDLFSRPLWTEVASLGWPAIALPEAYGGVGLGYLELCVLAEELGRSLAPIPFSSSVYLFAEMLQRGGSEQQKSYWLPKIAAGECIGSLAYADGFGFPAHGQSDVTLRSGRLTGTKWPVADGAIAQVALVLACDESGENQLCLVELDGEGVTCETMAAIDPSRPMARLCFENAECEVLPEGDHWQLFQSVLDAAAVLFAFEQVGGADRCLEIAVEFSRERAAFGRVIGSFQAIKHKLADMYVNNQLARGNAYYGAWALSSGASELPLAAAVARVSSTEAFEYAARESLQVHGGMGFTWEADCHLFLRRSRTLAVNIGGVDMWKARVSDELKGDL